MKSEEADAMMKHLEAIVASGAVGVEGAKADNFSYKVWRKSMQAVTVVFGGVVDKI